MKIWIMCGASVSISLMCRVLMWQSRVIMAIVDRLHPISINIIRRMVADTMRKGGVTPGNPLTAEEMATALRNYYNSSERRMN